MTAAPPDTRMSAARSWRAVGVLGEILIAFGVLLLLFVAYQLWWTNVTATRAADSAASQLRDSWAQPAPGDGRSPDDQYQEPDLGQAFALMYIPRLSDKVWGTPVVEGVQAADLAQGIGHYPGTAMPGEVGNFAVAAHRATNGEPFRDVDRLRAGDRVYVETSAAWFVYELDRDELVAPDDVWVIGPVPGRKAATPTESLITLTTCHPRWGHAQRWVWWGTLVDQLDKASGRAPDAIEAGR